MPLRGIAHRARMILRRWFLGDLLCTFVHFGRELIVSSGQRLAAFLKRRSVACRRRMNGECWLREMRYVPVRPGIGDSL